MCRYVALSVAAILVCCGFMLRGGGNTVDVIYYSTTGNDVSGDGSLGNPYATPGRAQTAERGAIVSGHCAQVIGRGGVYHLPSTLAFTSADSGVGGCVTNWTSYAGEVAVLSGGLQITGWSLCTTSDAVCNGGAAGIYQASVVLATYPREFYFGATADTMSHRTRAQAPGTYPAGFSANTSTGVITGPSSGTFAAMASWGNPTDVELRFRWGWSESRCTIALMSGTPAVINMSAPCAASMINWGWVWTSYISGPTNPYQVENAYELLPACGAGCWYYNRTTHVMYYHPNGGENMTTGVAMVPSAESLISGIGVSNLIFSRLAVSFQSYDWVSANGGYFTSGGGIVCCSDTLPVTMMAAAVDFGGGSSFITFDHMLFAHNAGRSLYLESAVSDVLIYACDFEDGAGGDLQVGDLGTVSGALRITVKDNKFAGESFEYPDAGAVSTTFTDASLFDHNFVPTTPIYPLQYGSWVAGLAPSGTSNISTNNKITGYCSEVPFSDCGAIHINSPGLWTFSGEYVSGAPPKSVGCFYPDSPAPSGPQNWTNVVCDGNADRALYIQGSNGHAHDITFTAPWYSTNPIVVDDGISDVVASPISISAGCGANSACLAIKNNAGIEAGVTPGP